MKRIAFMALFAALVATFFVAAAACYNPKTPTPHPGETVGPAGPTAPYGLATPGLTVPATWRGPTQVPYANAPNAPAPGEALTPVPRTPGATSVPPVYDTLTPSFLRTPAAP